ncbi:hypothetical protein FOPG_17853 [Fusarium oxysporum f. sp. conglutinans race 2 54008]|nr:hypothetical protein FOPG_17853 [Fusarium oxysporum f. sp. conglutinans race 2 54008]
MASPVSIGDAFLMAKLAFRIGQAFTKGKKSAPAELREVESQLYSLSAALNALTAARKSGHSAPLLVDRSELPQNAPPHYKDNQDIILGMLGSCNDTLAHLQSIVVKYGIISTTADPSHAQVKRWSHKLKADWKRIAWTTEGGDLAALKSDLTIQTNSLNLILGVIVTSHTDRLQSDMNRVSVMLTEIHDWFVENLKSTTESASALATCTPNETSAGPSDGIYFQLFVQSKQNSTLICPRASLSQNVSGVYYSKSLESSQLFSCGCPDSSTNSTVHQSAVELYELSPLSFIVRIAGSERSWLLYKIANRVTNQLVTLVVKGVPSHAMDDFEELFVHGLSVIQARDILRRDTGTMLAHASENEVNCPKANILDIISNAATGHQSISAVKFTSGNVHHLRDTIKYVQMLHYKTVNLDRILKNEVLPRSDFKESENADVLIVYGKDDNNNNAADEIVSTILHSATQFYYEMEAIRMDLFVIHLQYPRDNERTVLKLQAQDVHTPQVHIRNADMSILQNTTTHRFRLLVQSRAGYSILSQELKADFFDTLVDQGQPDYGALAYEVHMDETGKRHVRQLSKGFHQLVFTDSKIDKVFSMGLRAVGRLPQLHISEGPQLMEGIVSE